MLLIEVTKSNRDAVPERVLGALKPFISENFVSKPFVSGNGVSKSDGATGYSGANDRV